MERERKKERRRKRKKERKKEKERGELIQPKCLLAFPLVDCIQGGRLQLVR